MTLHPSFNKWFQFAKPEAILDLGSKNFTEVIENMINSV